jgi:hypothetical protein
MLTLREEAHGGQFKPFKALLQSPTTMPIWTHKQPVSLSIFVLRKCTSIESSFGVQENWGKKDMMFLFTCFPFVKKTFHCLLSMLLF